MGKNADTGFLLGGLALFAILIGTSKKSNSMPANNPLSNDDIRLPFDGTLTNYVKLLYPYVLEAHKQYPKVPVNLMLTQSALESERGKAAPGNMFFGVKAGANYQGDKQLLRTTEVLPKGSGYNFPDVISIKKLAQGGYIWTVRDYFRKYPTPLGSFLDYCKLISTPHYAKVIAASPDINKMIVELKAAGYATGPKYVPSLQSLAVQVQKAVSLVA